MAFRLSRLSGALLACAALAPGPASAALSVYQSSRDNDLDSGPAQIHAIALVHVYFNNGNNAPAPGNACTPAGADEICRWAVRFETTGNLKIVDVAWGNGVIEDDPPIAPATQIDGTGGDSVNGDVGATKIATVSVRGTEGQLRLTLPAGFGFADRNAVALTPSMPQGYVLIAEAAGMPWTGVSANEDHVCGVLGNGELRCFGDAFTGSPAIPGMGAARQVAVGHDFACAIDYQFLVSCWGSIGAPPSGQYLMLAGGAAHMCGLRPDLGVECWGGSVGNPPAPGRPFQSVTRGYDHACALAFNGSVSCWGDDSNGQASPPPELFADLAGGGSHTCGLLPDGTAECWGDNSLGQVTPPGDVFSEITAGENHTCAIKQADQTVKCWGDDFSNQSSPPPFDTFSAISAAQDFTCGVRTDGSLVCWGDLAPTAPFVPYPEVSAGGSHTCEIYSNGSLGCWTSAAQPGLPPLGTYVEVDSGVGFSCAVEDGGNVDCWGLNSGGQSTPPGGSFTLVGTGNGWACGERPNASYACWPPALGTQPGPFLIGGGGTGLLFVESMGCSIGPNLTVTCNGMYPATPPGGAFSDVTVGRLHICGLRTNGTIACWGTLPAGASPPDGSFLDVVAGAEHTCGLRPDGSVVCWGADSFGETVPPALSFVQLEAGGASGSGHTCGVTTRGSIACWGDDSSGQCEPPFDLDIDGLEDPVDNCPLAWNFDQLDGDSDGAGDACDVCAGTPNPDQFDRDADGVGDLCDNCVDTANADQTDVSPANGVGDACEPAQIILRENFGGGGMLASQMLQSGGDKYDVFVSCPLEPIKRIELGLRLPSSLPPESIDFGPGCSDQNCNAAATMGSTVDKTQSFYVKPSNSTGGSPNTIYFVLQASPATNRLCEPNTTVRVASIGVSAFPSDGSRPSFTQEGAFTVAPTGSGAGVFQDVTFKSVNNVALAFDQYAFAVGPEEALIDLQVVRDPTDGEGRTWFLTLDSEVEIQKLTIGVTPPAGTSYQDVNLIGCPSQLPPATAPCTSAEGSYIKQSSSRVVGPAPTGLPRTDTMYVTLEGNLPGSNYPTLSLNVPGLPATLGRVRVATGQANVAPVLTTEGSGTVMGGGNAFVRADAVPVAVFDYTLIGSGETVEDSDGDGFVNNTDNCLYVANDQADRGGLDTSLPDGRGDACQCGDTDHNGEVRTADVAALRQVLAGQTADPVAKELCSVSGSTVCDVKDALELAAKLQNPSGGLSPACARAFPPGLPTDP
jgi:alpha-tubulin suppressor-like RCC1 family protein